MALTPIGGVQASLPYHASVQRPAGIEAGAASPPAAEMLGVDASSAATRGDFSPTAAGHRSWSLAEVSAALGTPAQVKRLLAAADTPGPIEPGSLIAALKTIRGAATPGGETADRPALTPATEGAAPDGDGGA